MITKLQASLNDFANIQWNWDY